MSENKIIERLPKHIAIIMDGNGRWAKKRLMPRLKGHQQGVSRMVGLLQYAYKLGVDYMTVYALSTENLNRPKEELAGLYDLIRTQFESAMAQLDKYEVRVKIIGDVSLLPKDVQEIVQKVEKKTEKFTGKGLNVALAYGSRAELVRAVNQAIEAGEKLTEESLSNLLYTGGQPDPDLVIRTGKEKRLSNFLLYQSAYAELYFSDKMFPEFLDEDLQKAIEDYSNRTRRFGKTDEQRREENL
ncbi:MAG: di-trans,poly-cis-decaprenylcistransferase [Clostridia bacterium]|nr:di-trans,poly-cis-decaprenylcistransferase [Clostridia bacterium]